MTSRRSAHSIRPRARAASAAVVLLLGATWPQGAASALDLRQRDSFPFPRASSLAWDPWLCGLWVAIEGPQLFLLTPDGREIRRIEPDLSPVRSLTVEKGGLLIADGWGRAQRPSGWARACGIRRVCNSSRRARCFWSRTTRHGWCDSPKQANCCSISAARASIRR